MLKSVSGGCALKAVLVGANDAWIRWNFAQSDCMSHRAPTSKSPKRRGLGGYMDAKVHSRGLLLRSRARRCKWCLNTVQLYPNSLQVTPGAHLKKWGLGGYADAKLRFRGLAPSRQGLRESTLPKYDGTLPELIASHGRPWSGHGPVALLWSCYGLHQAKYSGLAERDIGLALGYVPKVLEQCHSTWRKTLTI